MISWQNYNHAIIPLIQRFGAHHYPKETIQKGFYYWKSKDQAELLDEVNRAVAFNQPLELVKAVDQTKRPERTKWEPEEYNQTEGFLSEFLDVNQVSSVIELLDKERERIRMSKA